MDSWVKFYAGPTSGGPASPMQSIVGACLSMAVLAVFDYVVARHSVARWFVVHAFANAFVTFLGLPDVIRAFGDPTHAGKGDYALIPFYMIAACECFDTCILWHVA